MRVVYHDRRPSAATTRATPRWTLHHARSVGSYTLCGQLISAYDAKGPERPQGEIRACRVCASHPTAPLEL